MHRFFVRWTERRWLAYWKIRKWQERRISAGEFGFISIFVLGIVKIVHLGFFLISCPACSRAFFFKDALSFNYMVDSCPHCGLNIGAWAEERLEKER